MILLNDVLPIILYMLGAVLLVILIIIGLRMIKLMDRLKYILDDVDHKVKSLNGIFHIIDVTTDNLSFLTDKLVESISNFISNLFNKKKKMKEEEEENE